MIVPHTAQDFEAKFAASDDPWQFKSRWYEARKRAITLACLPAARYANAYEPGCANGELSAELAARCDHLWASDGSAKAVALARTRLSTLPNVQVSQAWVPDQWPTERFDLIVISELGYFLSGDALCTLIDKSLASLQPGGTVLACHWRPRSSDCEFDGDEVHRRLAERIPWPRLSQVMEADFRIDVWCHDPRSVAQREGWV